MDKLTKPEAIAIAKDFIDSTLIKEMWYQNISSQIKAVVLYGSTAKGLNRIDSDIDILIFVPLEIEEKYTKGEYFFEYKGREINIVLRSIEKLRGIASDRNDKFQSEVFRESEILLENDGEVRELLKFIETISKSDIG